MSVTRPLAGPAKSLVAAAALLLLSGCGVAGTGWHPGVAAEVGDESISTDHVNDVVTSYCDAIEDQLTEAGNVIPLRYLREGVTGQLVMAAAARQLAAEYDVEPGDQYTRQVAQLEQAVAELPEDAQAAVIEVEASETYINGILQAVGKKTLADADSTSDEELAAGKQVLTTWMNDNDVEIDPEFGVEIVDGQPTRTDTNISFAAGKTAKLAVQETPDPAYSKALPASHRCG